jgi:hypothetical protein
VKERAERGVDSTFVRLLGASEQGVDAMENAGGDCHIVRVINYEGALNPELFERALHNLLRRRPLLTTEIVRPPDEVPYFCFTGERPRIAFVERGDGDQWRAEFERQLARPLLMDGRALLRLTALTGGRGGEIVISCHHAVCDGRSLTAFCRDLAHEYEWLLRGAPGDPVTITAAVPPPLEDVVPLGLTGSSGEKIMAEYRSRLGAQMTSPPGFFMEFEPEPPQGRHLLTYEVPPAAASALVALAHSNGTTIGGAISAAMLRAGLDIGGPGAEDTVGLRTNIDLRPYLREDVPVANMGNFASSSFATHHGVRAKPFWTLARDVSTEIKSSIDSLQAHCAILLSKSNYEAHRDGVLPKMWPQFMLANLGRTNLPEPHEGFRVKSIHGGSPVFGNTPFFFCGAVGLSGSIFIDVNYRTPQTPNQVARDFGESLMQRLMVESDTVAVQPAPR